mgnify:CR=1 FL=1
MWFYLTERKTKNKQGLRAGLVLKIIVNTKYPDENQGWPQEKSQRIREEHMAQQKAVEIGQLNHIQMQDCNKIYLHAKEKVSIVFAVNRNKAVLPLQSCDTSRKTILHILEHTSPNIDRQTAEKSFIIC